MWPCALALAGLLTFILAREVPFPVLLDLVPVLGSLHQIGGPWAFAVEALAATTSLLGGVALTGLLYRAIARISGQTTLSRFFQEIEDLRSLRPWALGGLVMLLVLAGVQVAVRGFQAAPLVGEAAVIAALFLLLTPDLASGLKLFPLAEVRPALRPVQGLPVVGPTEVLGGGDPQGSQVLTAPTPSQPPRDDVPLSGEWVALVPSDGQTDPRTAEPTPGPTPPSSPGAELFGDWSPEV